MPTENKKILTALVSFSALAMMHTMFATAPLANQQNVKREGIWKSAVPPGGMKGEFNNHDPVGLATGAKIKVDCSLNWPDPDTGKIYCFNSPTSLVYFLDWPKRNIEKAKKGWAKLKNEKGPQ